MPNISAASSKMDYKTLLLCLSAVGIVSSAIDCTYSYGSYSCKGPSRFRLTNPHKGPIFSLKRTKVKVGEIKANAFTEFPLIKYLTLKNIGINIIANGAFNGLPNLVTLDLSENNITSLSLGNMPKLTKLEISDNKIGYLNLNLNNLRILNMDHNLVTNLTFVENLPALRHLRVSSNRLSCVNKNSFLNVPLETAILSDNPWRKGCGRSLAAWLEQRNVYVMDRSKIKEFGKSSRTNSTTKPTTKPTTKLTTKFGRWLNRTIASIG